MSTTTSMELDQSPGSNRKTLSEVTPGSSNEQQQPPVDKPRVNGGGSTEADEHGGEDYSIRNPNLKRNRDDPGREQKQGEGEKQERSDLYWKTSLCSFYRRLGKDCSHGYACRYAHGEEELRPKPDGSWDPTSERAKKLRMTQQESGSNNEVNCNGDNSDDNEDVVLDESSLDKCLIGLPKGWNSDKFKSFLEEKGILYNTAKKKKGMTVGFVKYNNYEQVKNTVQIFKENSNDGKQIRVADANNRSHSNNKEMATDICTDRAEKPLSSSSCLPVDEDATGKASSFEGLDPKMKSARDVVTPLAHLSYKDQLEHKKKTVSQLLKRLTRNARKACPHAVPLPEWILKSREIGGLPCQLEGILESPVINGYRNKCEFSVGYSPHGKKDGWLHAWKFQVREGRHPNQSSEENQIAEVMLIIQVCSSGVDKELIDKEFERMVHALAHGASGCSPPLPLTSVVVQDHIGISNVAPAVCPLIPLPIPGGGHCPTGTLDIMQSRIHDYICNLCFSISPTAFFQVNTPAAERLYTLAGDWADLSPDTLLFDICCGTGTIGITLAHRVGMVVGIEMNASAVSDARRNAEINGLKNCNFVCGKAEDVIGTVLSKYADFLQDGNPYVCNEAVDNKTLHSDHERHQSTRDSEAAVASDSMPEKVQTTLDDHPSSSMNRTAKDIEGLHYEDSLQNGSYGQGGSNLETSCEKLLRCTTKSMGTTLEDSEIRSTNQNILEDSVIGSTNQKEIVESDNGTNTLAGKFKKVVAIVDPPRSGLHPTVIKALRTNPHIRSYISCNPENLVANAIELCTPTAEKQEKTKGNRGWRNMSSAGIARQRTKSMPKSEAFTPVRAMAVDLFPHTIHCEMVMLLESNVSWKQPELIHLDVVQKFRSR